MDSSYLDQSPPQWEASCIWSAILALVWGLWWRRFSDHSHRLGHYRLVEELHLSHVASQSWYLDPHAQTCLGLFHCSCNHWTHMSEENSHPHILCKGLWYSFCFGEHLCTLLYSTRHKPLMLKLSGTSVAAIDLFCLTLPPESSTVYTTHCFVGLRKIESLKDPSLHIVLVSNRGDAIVWPKQESHVFRSAGLSSAPLDASPLDDPAQQASH